MKKSYVVRLGVLALALTLVTTCLTGGTLAKYTSELSGTGIATVAAWSFKATSGGESADITTTEVDLGSTANRTDYDAKTVKEGVIAPGTKGSFNIVIDGTGSEVGIEYALKIEKTGANEFPAGLTFTSNADGTEKAYTLGTEATGKIDYSDTAENMKKTITFNWEWADTADNDADDTAKADKDLSFNITVTGTQAAPTATTPAA